MANRPYRKLPSGPIKGLNLVPTLAQIQSGQATAHGSVWAQFWSDFSWDGSPTSINGQINFAKSLGCNAIRIIGNGGSGLWAGAFTQAQYLARQSQVIAYCQSLGLYYYLTIGGQNEYQGYRSAPGGDGTQTGYGAILAWASALIASASKFPNVIGVDLCQETFGLQLFGAEKGSANQPTTSQIVSLMQQLLATCRAAAPDLAAAFSWTTAASYQLADGSHPFDLCAQSSDHVDRHIYYDVVGAGVPADMASVASCSGKQVLIGEHGWAESNGESARITQLDSIYSHVINNPAINCVGGLAWACIPQDTVGGSNDFGFGDLSGSPRSVGTRYQAAYHANPNLSTGRRRAR